MRTRLALSALLLASAAGCYQQQVEAGGFDFITSRLNLVVDRLGAVARGSANSSELSIGQLEEAYGQTQQWGFLTGQQIKEADAKLHLVADLLVAMHDHFEQADCVARLEAYYKLYEGHIPQESEFGACKSIAPVTNKLVASLLELTGHETLSRQLLNDSYVEYNNLVSKFNGIEIDEIAETEDELEDILTFLNLDQTLILAKKIFPKVPKSTTDKDLDDLKRDFGFEMRGMAYVVHGGQLIKLKMPRLKETPIEWPLDGQQEDQGSSCDFCCAADQSCGRMASIGLSRYFKPLRLRGTNSAQASVN